MTIKPIFKLLVVLGAMIALYQKQGLLAAANIETLFFLVVLVIVIYILFMLIDSI